MNLCIHLPGLRDPCHSVNLHIHLTGLRDPCHSVNLRIHLTGLRQPCHSVNLCIRLTGLRDLRYNAFDVMPAEKTCSKMVAIFIAVNNSSECPTRKAFTYMCSDLLEQWFANSGACQNNLKLNYPGHTTDPHSRTPIRQGRLWGWGGSTFNKTPHHCK